MMRLVEAEETRRFLGNRPVEAMGEAGNTASEPLATRLGFVEYDRHQRGTTA